MTRKMDREKEIDIHLKLDDTLINLLQDYHDISPAEAITFFHGLSLDMIENEGNVINKNKNSEKIFTRSNGTTAWRSAVVKPASAIVYDNYDAYAFRGFYPGSKIPFKLSGVKAEFGCCFVVSIGNKNKNQSVHPDVITKIKEAVSEAILLDAEPVIEEHIYKSKTFRCMRPKGMPLMKKSK